jgi:hypothetical protein
MNEPTGRMLLSQNFDLYDNLIPAMNREEFAKLFIDGLKEKNLTCNAIDNPHWAVEIIFPPGEFSAREIGEQCGRILLEMRKSQNNPKMPDILILGGKKTTPAIGISPTSLQPGEWGVDVVETAVAETFLASIDWNERSSQQPVENIFKIELIQ